MNRKEYRQPLMNVAKCKFRGSILAGSSVGPNEVTPTGFKTKLAGNDEVKTVNNVFFYR